MPPSPAEKSESCLLSYRSRPRPSFLLNHITAIAPEFLTKSEFVAMDFSRAKSKS
jgi:hypothetical protein